MEAWKFADVELRKEFIKLLRMIWKKGDFGRVKEKHSGAFI